MLKCQTGGRNYCNALGELQNEGLSDGDAELADTALSLLEGRYADVLIRYAASEFDFVAASWVTEICAHT